MSSVSLFSRIAALVWVLISVPITVAASETLGVPASSQATSPNFEWNLSSRVPIDQTLKLCLGATSEPPGLQDGQLDSGASASTSSSQDLPPQSPEISTGGMFARGWLLITGVEVVLLGVTASMPKEWTGWSSTFVADGLHNFREAYRYPPVWDDDHWFHNYIGHPYGGSVYYNTVRCQGASPFQSFIFSGLMSLQWEYVFEAVAERPSTQDLIITPIAGALLGECVNQLTQAMRADGTNLLEDIVILILNPTSIILGP